MIGLEALAELAAAHPDDLDLPVAPIQVAGRTFDTDAKAAIMGVVNLSRDSTYRSSIAPSIPAAIRRGTVLAAQGADIVDVGAESTNGTAARVSAQDQIDQLVPVIVGLADQGVLVSTESYDIDVVRATLKAGARVINLTGSTADDPVFELAAEFEAAVVLCHLEGDNARDLDGSDLAADPIPGMLAGFARRIDRARELGAHQLVIDPGAGFHFGVPQTPAERIAHQTTILLNAFRLRRLGVPICQSVPHGFDLFEDEFRSGEAFFTVLARLGGAGMIRTHEVPGIVPVLRAMSELPAT
ncbi:dihydropteroate synthase [Nocardioides sp.]|uniref:dihydropteroate synthase n=1 Tax=Nocardioides sp. TaxID=35761 RepID=UPI0035665016